MGGLKDLVDGNNGIECGCGEQFSLGNQRKIMGEYVDHLITEHNLLEEITTPIAPQQAQKNVLISEEGVRIHQYHPENRNIQGEYELSSGNFLNTNYAKEDKERYIQDLAQVCDLEVDFADNWG